jgi:hypothetical protein
MEFDYDRYGAEVRVGDTIVFATRARARFDIDRGVVKQFHASGKVTVEADGYKHVINGLKKAVKV